MNKKLILLTGLGIGAGLGAGLMFMLDPEKGKDRRTLICNKVTDTIAKTEKAIVKTPQDIRKQINGLIAESRLLYNKARDEALENRVYTKIGQTVNNPGLIQVIANNGHLILTGSIPAIEEDALLEAVFLTRGVKTIENRLEVHARAGDLIDIAQILVESSCS